MSLTNGGWIHSFTITETNTHKKGFTIYKITSIVFPRAIPQALTCISTWKRFHDVKRLYRDLQKRHKSVQGSGQVPELKANSYFKRFEPEIIQTRKDYIIELLDFAAQHPALYKSQAFLKFFENGLTPNTSPLHSNKKLVGGNIETICDNLDLTFEDDINLIDPTKDTSNLTTNKKFIKSNDELEEISNVSAEKKNEFSNKENIKSLPNQSAEANIIQKDETKKEKDYSKILTPMVSFEGEDMDYIYEAALEFSHAVQAEVNLEYEDAFKKYKNGVEKLLMGSKDETNDERKYIAKGKVAKYMARADEIYEKYILHSDKKKLSVDMSDSSIGNVEEIYLERPWNQLSRFKVMQILESSVLQVQDVTDKSIYILKGIEKPSCNTRAQSIFLPQNVPYMVELIGYYQSNDKIFLLLRKAKGGKLFDYIRSYTPTAPDSPISLNEIFTEIKEKTIIDELINNEKDIITKEENCITSDSGYAEHLISTSENIDQISDKENEDENNKSITDDDKSFEFETKEYIPSFDILSQDMEVNDLVNCSQKLIQSVSKTLDKSKENEFIDINIIEKIDDENELKTVQENNIEKIQLENPEILLENLTETPKSTAKKKKLSIPEISIKQWARELVAAMECLHNKGVILGDLHSDNILLGSKGQLLLSYFHQNEGGNPDSHLFYNPLINETLCIAPERPLTIKSDWWSLGIILFELLTGYTYISCHPGGFYSYFEIQLPINTDISKEAKSLLDGLLQPEPEYRLNLDGIKLHKFFEGTLWDEVAKNGVNSN